MKYLARGCLGLKSQQNLFFFKYLFFDKIADSNRGAELHETMKTLLSR